jgi:hypothetical protein
MGNFCSCLHRGSFIDDIKNLNLALSKQDKTKKTVTQWSALVEYLYGDGEYPPDEVAQLTLLAKTKPNKLIKYYCKLARNTKLFL